jgi:DNA-directed RNA polymerase specialized sigma24 family protein
MKTLARDLERVIAQLPQHLEPGRDPQRKPRKRRITELNAVELTAMIADYTAGATLKQLAAIYHYSHVGISDALEGVGVQLRRRGLTNTQADEAEHLYATGQSLARIAERMEVNPSSVRALLQRGVTMRPASQRH